MPGQLIMEAPLQQLPAMQQAFNCKHDAAAAATDMACLQQQQPSGNAGAREQCPRCASHDTKFCYYNNYNTSQPRHFCRACRRYWTLGGSLRNVPIGGSTRKRLRPAPPAVRRPQAHFGGGPPQPSHSHQHGLLSSLFALGAAPLLEGRVGFDLGLGLPGLGNQAGGGEFGGLHALGLRGGPAGSSAPLLWPAGLLESGHNVDAWKVSGGGPAGMWAPEFSAAATTSQMVHGGAQML